MFKKKLAIVLAMIVMTVFSACEIPGLSSVDVVENSESTAPFELRMLDVGQGLCVVVKSDDRYLIFDGGGRESSSYVAGYMREHKIKNVDYLIASHYDEDHISGLIGIMHVVKADRILTPDYTCDSAIYDSFKRSVAVAEAAEEHPHAGDTYSLGEARIEVVGPGDYDSAYENNRCIAIRITYEDFSCIMTGDAEWEEEDFMVSSGMKLKSTVYVAGHHGSAYSSSSGFLDEVSPKAAFISCGKDNKYGHPSEDTIERLEDECIKIFRTDIDGEVTAYSDGGKVWFQKNGRKSVSETGNASGKYVLNTNSMKFHKRDCSCVQDMSDYNKIYTDEDRRTLVKEGYDPCGFCNP